MKYFATTVTCFLVGLLALSTGCEKPGSSGLNYEFTAIPEFNELGDFKSLGNGLESAFFRSSRVKLSTGNSCKLLIVRPEGTHAAKSLPCYFLAAAGATSLTGKSLADGDLPELEPWAKEGFVAVGYETDGELISESDAAFDEAMNAYEKSQGGLVNARNAIEFVLEKMPEVDPERIYTGGHSSAGSQSILLASFDKRIKAAISFNGVIDKVDELRQDAGSEFNSLPQTVVTLLKKLNPAAYESQIQCPVFLFHTEEDATVGVAQSRNAHQRFKQNGVDVTLEIGHGDHYNPMLDQGIPKAISWLKAIDSKHANHR